MRRTLCIYALTLFSMSVIVSCGSTTQQPEIPRIERPAKAWPQGSPSCAVPSLEEASPCSSPLVIMSDSGGASPIAIINRPSEVDLTWRELPLIDSGGRAKVDVFSPVLFSGWASLEDAGFSLTADVEVYSKHLVAKQGTPVTIVGTTRDKVVVKVPTVFRSPESIEVAVDCHVLRYGSPEQASATVKGGRGFLTPRSANAIKLRTSTEGPSLLTFWPLQDQVFHFMEQRGTAVRIAGGVERGTSDSTKLFFDGWADVSQFYMLERRPSRAKGSGCLPRSYDECPANRGETVRDARLYFGYEPPGRHFATVKIGTAVRVGEEHDDLAAVSFMGDAISPPRGLQYFMKRDAIRDNCHGDGHESKADPDGCIPCGR